MSLNKFYIMIYGSLFGAIFLTCFLCKGIDSIRAAQYQQRFTQTFHQFDGVNDYIVYLDTTTSNSYLSINGRTMVLMPNQDEPLKLRDPYQK